MGHTSVQGKILMTNEIMIPYPFDRHFGYVLPQSFVVVFEFYPLGAYSAFIQ